MLWTLAAGAVVGLIVLGGGGRLAMSAVQVARGNASRYTLGGTMTVVFMGGVSGLAGAAIALASEWLARRFLPDQRLQYVLFGGALALVTARGLSGTPRPEWWYFYIPVAVYGVVMSVLISWQKKRAGQSHLPAPRERA
jgi:hypothetical protein